jgi:hypothetical protein
MIAGAAERLVLEQRPLNMNHIERISCCFSIIFERNFDPNRCKRALISSCEK